MQSIEVVLVTRTQLTCHPAFSQLELLDAVPMPRWDLLNKGLQFLIV
jgi:hypothetical protein